MRKDILFVLMIVALLGFAPWSDARKRRPVSGGSDECLIGMRDETAAIADGSTECQVSTGRFCTFNLQLCLNQAQDGCEPGNFTKPRFKASGHCGPVGQLQVDSAGTGSVCGAFTGIKVRTRASRKSAGQCTIRAAARSSKAHGRTDVDTVTLVCMPKGKECPTTTTTSTTSTTEISTTTTTAP